LLLIKALAIRFALHNDQCRLPEDVCYQFCIEEEGDIRAFCVQYTWNKTGVAITMSLNKNVLLAYLEGRRYPVAQLDGAALLHSALCEAAPLFYLHLLTDRATDVSHKREILWNWLTNPAARTIEQQYVLHWLKVLPGEQALKVIELVSDLRINRHRAGSFRRLRKMPGSMIQRRTKRIWRLCLWLLRNGWDRSCGAISGSSISRSSAI
jgi:hypothetical protein